MPAGDKRAAPDAGQNPDRFYCPYPGCNRSFAELWRLKVHYRAPPDVRGSGKERGHGTELDVCPKCNKELRPGKHHVGCSAGRSAPRQAAKRIKTGGESERDPNSVAIGQPVSAFPFGVAEPWTFDGDDPFGLGLTGGAAVAPNRVNGAVHALGHSSAAPSHLHEEPGRFDPWFANSSNGDGQHGEWHGVHGVPAFVGVYGVDPSGTLRPADMMWGPHLAPANLQPPALPAAGFGGSSEPWPGTTGSSEAVSTAAGCADGRPPSPPPLIPSPPPLPFDWEQHLIKPSPLLFDFDIFNTEKPREDTFCTRPMVTVTSAMPAAELAHPPPSSEEYMMQIMFGDANARVPRRIMTHMHHVPDTDSVELEDNVLEVPHTTAATLDDLLKHDPSTASSNPMPVSSCAVSMPLEPASSMAAVAAAAVQYAAPQQQLSSGGIHRNGCTASTMIISLEAESLRLKPHHHESAAVQVPQ